MNMNKKLISIAAGVLSAGLLSADGGSGLPKLSLDTSIGFDSEYVDRGFKLGQQVFTPSIGVSASLLDQGELYFSNKNFLSVKSSDHNRHDISIGFSYNATEILVTDIGFNCHLRRNIRQAIDKNTAANSLLSSHFRTLAAQGKFAKENGVKRYSAEIYMGFIADVLLTPSFYYTYDISWRRHNLEGKVDYLHELSSIGINGFTVDLFAKFGFDHTQKPLGIKKTVAKIVFWDNGYKKSYWYYGLGAGLSYFFNENAKVCTSVKFEGMNKKKAWVYRDHKNFFWCSLSFDCSC
jgi:hypothetical protein